MADATEADRPLSGPIRVVHVTLAHDYRDVRIFEKECASLAAAGYEVFGLVPGAPEAVVNGVRLRPLNTRPGGFLPLRYVRRLIGVYRSAAALRADIYHLHDPELIPLGLLLRRHGALIVYDAHEDAPVEALSLNRARPAKGRLLALVWRLFIALAKKFCDGLIAATPDVAATLAPRPVTIVHNFPRLEKFAVLATAEAEARDPARLVYAGNISEIRGLFEMLDALALVAERRPCRLRLAGRFASAGLQAQAEAHPAWVRVDYLGQIPWPQVIAELRQSAVGLLLLHPTPEYVVSIPTKLFEYMAAGIPVVCSDFPLLRRIVEAAGCGVLADPCNPAVIAAAILPLLADPALAALQGRKGRQAVESTYSWETEAEALLSLYGRLVPSGPLRSGRLQPKALL